MIGLGGVGFVFIMWTIATTIRRNDPTYMKDHHRRRLNRSMSPLNIKPYMLMFLATSSASESSIPKYALVAVMFA